MHSLTLRVLEPLLLRCALEAMSPDDFSLRLWNTRSKGDFALAYRIGEDSRSDFDVFSIRLEGGFALEPSLLPRFVANFGALLKRNFNLEEWHRKLCA